MASPESRIPGRAPEGSPGPTRKHSPPGPEVVERIRKLTGRRVMGGSVPPGGHSPAKRWILHLEGGERVFAKLATDRETDQELRREYSLHARIPSPHLARLLGFDPRPAGSLLLLEDLSAGRWDLNWTRDRVAAVEQAMVSLRDRAREAGLRLPRLVGPQSWKRIEAAPGIALHSRAVSPAWLRACLPALESVETGLDLSGDILIHSDLNEGNVFFEATGKAWILDWSRACLGHPRYDAMRLGLSAAVGGMPAEEAMADDPPAVAMMAGSLLVACGQPAPPGWQGLRQQQWRQLRVALSWIVERLGLPAPDGEAWMESPESPSRG